MPRIGRGQTLGSNILRGIPSADRLSYETDNGNVSINGTTWYAQQFIPGRTFIANVIAILMQTNAGSGNVNVSIYSNLDGKPGSQLATSTIANPSATLDWQATAPNAISQTLQAGTTYWLVVSCTSTLQIFWHTDGGVVGCGTAWLSTNSGSTWSSRQQFSFDFRVESNYYSLPSRALGATPGGLGQIPFYPTVLTVGKITFGAASRRISEKRRFPLQGFDETTVFIQTAGPFPVTPVIDVFDEYGAGSGGLNGQGDWSSNDIGGVSSGIRYNDSGNKNVNSSNGLCGAYMNTTYGPDSEAYVAIDNIDAIQSSNQLRVYVRMVNPTLSGAAGRGGYNVSVTSAGVWTLEKQTTGGTVVLATFSQAVAVGDKVGIRAVGNQISAWWFDSTGTHTWKLVGQISDDQWTSAGVIALVLDGRGAGWTIGTTWQADDFGGGTITGGTTLVGVLTRRRLGPFPPVVVGPVFTAPEIAEPSLTAMQAVADRVARRRRQPHWELSPPTVLALPPPPPITVNLAADLLRRRAYTRRFPLQGWEAWGVVDDVGGFSRSVHQYQRLLGPRPPLVQNPLPSQTQQTVAVHDPQAVATRVTRQQRAPHSDLFGFIPQVSAQPPPPIQVNLASDLLRRRAYTRRFPLQGWEQIPSMAGVVTFDNGTDGNSGDSLNFVHVVGSGRDRYLTVSVASNSTTVYSTGVTYAGADMTLLRREINTSLSLTEELWGLINPTPGANHVVVTLSGARPGIATGAASFFGVDQINPTDGEARGISGNTGTTQTSAPKSGKPGGVIVDGIGAGGGPYLTWNGTLAWQDGGGEAQQFLPATVAPQTLSYTQTGSPNYADVIAALNPVSVGQVVLQQRFLGPRPPQVVAPAPPIQTIVQVNLATGLLTNQRRNTQRRPMYRLFGFIPQVSAQPPPISVNLATGLLTNQRRYEQRRARSFLNPPTVLQTFQGPTVALTHTRPRRPTTLYRQSPYLSPLAVITTPGQLVVATHLVRTRPRPTARFVLPPTVLQTFFGPRVKLTKTRPRPFAARYLNPATLEPEAVAIAEREIRTVLTRTRPRPTRHTLGPLIFYPATGEVNVTSVAVRARRDITRRYPILDGEQAPVFGTQAADPSTVPYVGVSDTFDRANANPMSGQWSTPTGPGSVSQMKILSNAALGTASTTSTARFNGYSGADCQAVVTVTVLPGAGNVAFLILREQASGIYYTAGYFQGTGWQFFSIDTGATLTQIGPTISGNNLVAGDKIGFSVVGNVLSLWRYDSGGGAWVFIGAVNDSTILGAGNAGLRVRGTAGTYDDFGAGPLTGPFIMALRQPFIGVKPPMLLLPLPTETTVNVTVAVARRILQIHQAKSLLFPPATLAQPPPFEPVAVTLVKTRPRPVVSRVVVPATLEPESVALSEREIRVVLTRTRPRHTAGTELGPLIFYPATSEILVKLVTTRPRPTHIAQRGLIIYAVADTTILVQNVRARPRPTTKFLQPPATLQPYAVTLAEDTVRVTLARTRPRPTTRRLAPPTVLQIFAGPATPLVHTRPRPTAAFVAPPATLQPYAVTLAEDTIRVVTVRTRPRHTVGTKLGYTVYPAVSEIAVTLVRTRPRPTRHSLTAVVYAQIGVGFTHLVRTRPRPTTRFVAPPATLQPYSVTIAEDTVRVAVVRTRPRRTLGTRLVAPTALQVFAGPVVYLTKTRPRPTAKHLQPPTAIRVPSVEQAEQTILVKLARTRPRPTIERIFPPATLAAAAFYYGPKTPLIQTRPRPTVALLAPPATLEPEAVAIRERTITTVLVRTRPRPTMRRLSYIVNAATSEISVTLVRTRPRPTRKTLGYVVYPATSEIIVTLVRTRPRPTRRILEAPIFYAAADYTILVQNVRTRPRPTSYFVAPPATLEPESVELAEETIRVVLTRTRPRHTLGTRLSYVVYPATSDITVALTRTRPRPTVHELTAVSYSATSEILVALVRARSRPLTRFVAPPSTLQPYAVTIAEDTVRVTLVRTRPRRTVGTRLAPPTVLQTFAGPEVALVHTRPRPTVERISPPTVIRVPSVEQREQTITTKLVRTRPRPTGVFIREPIVKTFPPVVTTLLPAALVKTRPRLTRKFLRPPTVVIPLPTLRMQTVTVAQTRIRPRPTRHTLGPLIFYRQTSTIRVKLVRARPRPKVVRLAPPTTLQTFGPPVESEIFVRTPVEDRTRRRVRSFAIQPVTYRATSEILVVLVRTRPRPTSRFLAPPTVLRTFAAPETPLVQTRPRPTRYIVRPPATLEPESVAIAEREERITLTRTRPRPTHSFLRPPAVVRTFIAAPVRVLATRTRPRPIHSILRQPTALQTFAGPLVALTRTRPRPKVARIEPPTRLRPVETTIRTVLVRTRPAHVRSNIEAPLVIVRPPVVTTITVKLVTTRPRPTSKLLAPPATLRRVFVFIAEPIRVLTVTTRPPRQAVTRIEPTPFKPGRDGFTTSTLIPTATASDSIVVVTGGALASIKTDTAESEVIGTSGGDIDDTLTEGGEIIDRPGGLT